MSEVALTITDGPCGGCPFKGRFPHLRTGRLRDIIEETTTGDGCYFSCHRTVGYDMTEEEENEYPGADAVFGPAAVCSGWLEAVETLGRVPQVVQVAQRLGLTEKRRVE